jgi:hypothetical protein
MCARTQTHTHIQHAAHLLHMCKVYIHVYLRAPNDSKFGVTAESGIGHGIQNIQVVELYTIFKLNVVVNSYLSTRDEFTEL